MAGYTTIPRSFLESAARAQWGGSATLVQTSQHAYGWGAKVPGKAEAQPIDLHGYSERCYGASRQVVLNHLGAEGWAWFEESGYTFQPVLIFGSEWRWDIGAVQWGVDNFWTNLCFMQTWLQQQLGKTFRLAERPQLIDCGRSSADLIALARSTAEPNKRFDLLGWVRQAYSAQVRPSSRTVYMVATFTGNSPGEDFGAAGDCPGNFCAVSSFASSVKIDATLTEVMTRLAYAITHEGLHTQGLPHSPYDGLSDAQKTLNGSSVMLWGRPGAGGILLPAEKQQLQSSPYFF